MLVPEETEASAQQRSWLEQCAAWDRKYAIDCISCNPVRRFRYRGGKLLFQRRGHLNPVRQDQGYFAGRAPAPKGIWAFPFPAGDIDFYSWHKWDEVVPKHLRDDILDALCDELYNCPDEEERALHRTELDALRAERERWISRQGPHVLPLRKFWYGGELYARISCPGAVRHGDWYLLSVEQFVTAARRLPPSNSGDHLEVFIPRP